MTGSLRRVVASVLESPEPTASIATLEPQLVGALIDQRGLADSAELIALLSAEQIADVFDDRLWDVDDFDAEEFALWLELMGEAGDAWLSERLTAQSEDLLVVAFHSLVIALSSDELTLTERVRSREDIERIERALQECPSVEIEHYLIVARRPDHWDAVTNAIVALHAHDHDTAVRVLDRCWELSIDEIADPGTFDDALPRHQMARADARGDRDDRRKRRGFVAKPDAQEFLARAHRSAEPDEGLFRAYLRALEPTEVAPTKIAEVLAAAQADTPKRALPSASPFERAMREVDDPALFERLNEEVVFLANVLVAAEDLRPADAARAVVRYADAGLAESPGPLTERSAIQLFRTGWRLGGIRSKP